MKTCIYTKINFESASDEHILQNFLGARWVSGNISCNEVQSEFGKTIDVALEKSLQQFRAMLGSKGGRGGLGPDIKNITCSKGISYHMKPGGIPYLVKPSITIKKQDQKQTIQLKLGDMKQLGWAVAELKKLLPEKKWDIGELKKKAVHERIYLGDTFHLNAGIGGSEYFRGILKSAFNLLGASSPETALLPCFDKIRTYILKGIGDLGNHVSWPTNADKLAITNIGEFDHFIAIYSQGQMVDGVVQLFGSFTHIIRLSDNYDGPSFCFSYQVDPLRLGVPAEIRNLSFSPAHMPAFIVGNEEATAEACLVYKTLVCRFLENHHQFAVESEIDSIIDEVLRPYEGEELSDEILNELAWKISTFFISRMRVNGFDLINLLYPD